MICLSLFHSMGFQQSLHVLKYPVLERLFVLKLVDDLIVLHNIQHISVILLLISILFLRLVILTHALHCLLYPSDDNDNLLNSDTSLFSLQWLHILFVICILSFFHHLCFLICDVFHCLHFFF